MNLLNRIAICAFFSVSSMSLMAADEKLEGTVIGSLYSVDYDNGSRQSTTVNTCKNAFDGDFETYFAAWDRDYAWAGLDLGSPHVITKVGWAPRNDEWNGANRVVLGVFEGANDPDFMDALPLYIITERGILNSVSYADVQCSRGFRYVRYVGPSNARCNISELEFYGHEGEGDDSHLYQLTNLPTVTIHTLDGEIPYDKEHEITSQLTIISEDGTNILSEPGSTRERGNFSRSFPKKPYRIKFEKKQNVLDAPAKAKKWTLINNYGDKTLMRNLLAFEVSRIVGMPYTPYGTPVDVLLNGEYKGCYQLCDQVQVHKDRVNITEMEATDIEGEALTGGYLIEMDAYANDEPVHFTSNNGTPVTIKSPDDDVIVMQQQNYIRNYFNDMERSPSIYLDYGTFLRHFLVGEFSGNTDTYWSVYMYKDRGDDLIYTGPVWDFDLAFENDRRTYPINSQTDYICFAKGSWCNDRGRNSLRTFVSNIVNGRQGASMLKDIWSQARQNGLTEDHMLAYVDKLADDMQASQTLNFMRWPILNEIVHENPRTYGSYEGEVENVRNYIKDRIAWLDNKIGYSEEAGITSVEVDFTKSYEVYSISGHLRGNSLKGLEPGVYIVKQGDATQKVVVGSK